MSIHVTSEKVTTLLDALYEDAEKSHKKKPSPMPPVDGKKVTERELFRAMRHAYMAISRDYGHLMYSLIRTSGARNVVEFGTSFGVSTIYLASAVKDNGGGKVITTEYEQEKAERAAKNIEEAGLSGLVDFRVGDATETLKSDLPEEIDFVFLDGAKSLYLDVLKVIEPYIKSGAIISSDNTDHDDMEEFLEYIRSTENGYLSIPIATTRRRGPSSHEITMKS